MKNLQPLSLPLTESSLIEASAGTGKTYTITTLYLRAILGLIDDTDELKPLSVDQILVVTFTEAATQEIKSRVRSKLVEVQQVIVTDNCADKLTQQALDLYLDRYSQLMPDSDAEQAMLAAYHKLQNAILLIDEAAIYTIHSFCHRCLKQFAFETNSSFEMQFDMDSRSPLLSALYDFWRKQVSELQGAEFEWFNQHWRQPNDLFNELRQLVYKPITILPVTESAKYQNLLGEYQRLVSQLKTQWRQSDSFEQLTNSGLNKRSKIYKRLAVLNEWMTTDSWLPPFAKDDHWEMWGSDSIGDQSNYSAKSTPLTLPICGVIDDLSVVDKQLKEGAFKAYWLELAKQTIEQRTNEIKTELQIINPDDLLLDLQQALVNDDTQVLVNAIRAKYPLAFIDEFQDTDPIQYSIFSKIYINDSEQELAPEANTSMVLIGDPKQAIYKFRGADIFTYIKAKQQIPENQIYTLKTNYRSSPGVVAAVNKCFQQKTDPFAHRNIPFIEVDAASSADNRLVVEDSDSPTLEFMHLTPEDENEQMGFSKSEADPVMATWCANQIKHLLVNASLDKATIIKSNKARAVKAGDICILVRNRHQARLVKQALNKQQVAAVYISRDSVLQTSMAKDLYRLLLAVASPNQEQLVRNACTTIFFSYSPEQLKQLFTEQGQTDFNWQQHLDWFYVAQSMFEQGHVAQAIGFIIEKANSFNKWMSDQPIDSDRLITDYRHLLELLQQEAVELAGSQKLLLWFEQQIMPNDEGLEATEEQQLRLETDQNLVQITTLHASKGLEYPIVYLPFVTEYKAASSAIFHSNSEQKGTSFRVDKRQLEMQLAEQERLAEDIRLLYVAMTRPVYKLVIGINNLQDKVGRSYKPALFNTAIGELLFNDVIADQQTVTGELIHNQLQKVCYEVNQVVGSGAAEINTSTPEQINNHSTQLLTTNINDQQSDLTLIPSVFESQICNDWRLLSYSSLASHTSPSVSNSEHIGGVTDEFSPIAIVEENVELTPSPFTFPKGANAGSCLHNMLELLDFQQPVDEQIDIIGESLTSYGIDEIWTPTVVSWMTSILNGDFAVQNGQIQLNKLQNEQKLIEMEFCFSYQVLSEKILSNALSMSGFDDVDINHLVFSEQQNLTGLLKGFIDLTFEYQGQYYVADYKSNYLGDKVEDYNEAAMKSVMTDHGYYLQALIYTLALHRFLRTRLSDYDYDKHIGGCQYLFLRGMLNTTSSTSQGALYLRFKKDVIDYLDNALLNGGDLDIKTKQTEVVQQPQQQGFDF